MVGILVELPPNGLDRFRQLCICTPIGNYALIVQFFKTAKIAPRKSAIIWREQLDNELHFWNCQDAVIIIIIIILTMFIIYDTVIIAKLLWEFIRMMNDRAYVYQLQATPGDKSDCRLLVHVLCYYQTHHHPLYTMVLNVTFLTALQHSELRQTLL